MIESTICAAAFNRENITRFGNDADDILIAFGIGADRAWILFRNGIAPTAETYAIFNRNDSIG